MVMHIFPVYGTTSFLEPLRGCIAGDTDGFVQRSEPLNWVWMYNHDDSIEDWLSSYPLGTIPLSLIVPKI